MLLSTRLRSIGWLIPAAGIAVVLAALVHSWQADAAEPPSDSSWNPIAPCRLFDTRPDSVVGSRSTPLGPDDTYVVTATGPQEFCNVPADATAISINLTGVNSTDNTFVAAYPADVANTGTSVVNMGKGQIATPNEVHVQLSADGRLTLYNAFGYIDLVGDVMGYYTPQAGISGSDLPADTDLAQLVADVEQLKLHNDELQTEVDQLSNDGLQAQIDQLKADKDKLQGQIDALDNDDLQAQIDQLKADKDKLQSQIDAILPQIDELNADNDELQDRVEALELANETLVDKVAELEEVGQYFSLVYDDNDNPVVRLTAANLQVVDGSGDTWGTPNGTGNLIVGYNEANDEDRTGSHNFVIGTYHSYGSYGGIVAGVDNWIDGPSASITGGYRNIATGTHASITGGRDNEAAGSESSVTGGSGNRADGSRSTVTSGTGNVADGWYASVTGGVNNVASGSSSTVSGGSANGALGSASSVSGGLSNIAGGWYTSVTGGTINTATGNNATVTGGLSNSATGAGSSVTGGTGNDATSMRASVTGGSYNTANGTNASVTGGTDNTASGANAAVAGGTDNDAVGIGAAVTGGVGNAANGENAAVTGGAANNADGQDSAVTGGLLNIASGQRSTVTGGSFNFANQPTQNLP